MKGKSSGSDFIYYGKKGGQLMLNNTFKKCILKACLFFVGRIGYQDGE